MAKDNKNNKSLNKDMGEQKSATRSETNAKAFYDAQERRRKRNSNIDINKGASREKAKNAVSGWRNGNAVPLTKYSDGVQVFSNDLIF